MKAWAESLGGITYPLLSDFYPHGEVAQRFGIFRSEGFSERAIFVIDQKGIVRYADVHDIDDQPDNDVLFEILTGLSPYAAAQDTCASAPEVAEPDADVVIYCTPWCSDCRKARVYLKSHGIDFVEIDVSRDRSAALRVRSWTGGREITPTFNIRGTIVVDYDRPRLAELLGIPD